MMLSGVSGRVRPGVGIARVIPILLACGLLVTIPSITSSVPRKILRAQQSPHAKRKKERGGKCMDQRKRTIGDSIGKAVDSVENDRTCTN